MVYMHLQKLKISIEIKCNSYKQVKAIANAYVLNWEYFEKEAV